ncbi:M48 family metallopeptidase [Pararhizobium haloflavum]|uniref:M48 family metallopeptidase n=1 Tax=Pararhizobium haloflavum TaxID=2037914 RepID=UPI000C176427|nr:SprT family zinc-dependent metalloprotease [Pararhizobium haloflavum]
MLSRLLTRNKTAARTARQQRRDVMVAGRALPLVVSENPRCRRLTLRIEPGGRGLKMTVPRGLPTEEIDRFLERQQGWLLTRLARFPASGTLAEGGSISLRGVPHRIRRTGEARGLTRAVLDEGEAVLEVGGAPEHLSRRVRDFLKREAKADLEAAVKRHCRALGRKALSIALKDTRSRWGSCTVDGALSFSWRIVMAPPDVLDYLAAHEVAHLKEMNHGPRFWALCAELCPQMDEAKSWLKRHGTLLHAVDFS